ncbi:MAG TPA: hypothetical protein VG675_24710 [Bryobacteraceae bacterium]|nr:hypothetical protein [Bryobacteraceae bacterium]
MSNHGELHIDPGALQSGNSDALIPGEIDVVVLYTGPALTAAVLQRAAILTAGLNATLELVAVHVTPYPSPFGCPISVHCHLVKRLIELSSVCKLPVNAHVVLARNREEGYRHVLRPSSTVLVGSRRHWWRTPEESLARALVRDGHQVALVHID